MKVFSVVCAYSGISNDLKRPGRNFNLLSANGELKMDAGVPRFQVDQRFFLWKAGAVFYGIRGVEPLGYERKVEGRNHPVLKTSFP
jgi:hypothetical protein